MPPFMAKTLSAPPPLLFIGVGGGPLLYNPRKMLYVYEKNNFDLHLVSESIQM